MDVAIVVTLVAYNLALIAIGLWAQKRAGSEDGFLLGGRNLGPVVAGLAYAASTSSAWVLLGFSGFAANAGVSALWMVPGILAGYIVVWFWFGPWLGRVSRERGYLTLIDFLSGEAAGRMRWAIKLAAVAMILIAFSYYIAAQFQGAGAALGGALGIDGRWGVILGALVILAYTFLGGFWAVSLTDTLQGLTMLAVAIILPIGAFLAAGGAEGVAAGLAANAPETFLNPIGSAAGYAALGMVLGLLATGFGALGQPHLLTWVMAVRDPKARLQGALVALGWGVFVYAGMAVLALSVRAMAAPDAVIGESVLFETAQAILPGVLPAIVYAAILSAIMSTVDSQLLVASAAVSHDLELGKRRPGQEVLVTRALIVALCAVAVAITFTAPATIFDRVLLAWTSLGAAFGPIVIAMVAGRKLAPATILAAMIAGFAVTLVCNAFFPSPGAWMERILPWVAGFAIVFGAPQVRRAAA